MVEPADDLSSVTVAVLAGGLGKRLRKVVADRPKPMAEVRGRSFLSYLFDQLHSAGLRRVVLCTGHLGEQVEESLGDSYRGMSLAYSREERPLGTGGALRLALPLLDSDPVLALNGDSFVEVDLPALWSRHAASGAAGTIVVRRVADTARYGRVTLAEDGSITRFAEKDGTAGAGWINAGIYLFGRDLIASIPADRPVSLEADMIPGWLGSGIHGFRTEGRFLDIGTPESYAEAERFFGDETAASPGPGAPSPAENEGPAG